MDKAIIDNKIVSAYEISLDYELEKAVRKYSRNKKILCVDSYCENPVLRYCHGDKKAAYFAHLTNTECDYDKFDKNDSATLKELRIKLFKHFTALGYKVETEYKLLKHHYSPVFCSKENESFVIEMGDSKTTMGHVEKLQREYALKQIPIKWLVVGEETLFLRENGVSFLKRFLLNESRNNDFILVDGNEIMQYRLDKKVYKLEGYSEIYKEKGTLKDLYVVNGELSINGFDSRFLNWQNKKEVAIEEELVKREALRKERERQEIKRREELEKQELIRKQAEKERIEKIINAQANKANIVQKQTHDYASTYTDGARIYTCTQCGKKADDGKFYMTQGDTGICWECHYGPERYAEIKKHRGW